VARGHETIRKDHEAMNIIIEGLCIIAVGAIVVVFIVKVLNMLNGEE
jgi:hypothetical protein